MSWRKRSAPKSKFKPVNKTATGPTDLPKCQCGEPAPFGVGPPMVDRRLHFCRHCYVASPYGADMAFRTINAINGED